MSARVPTNIPQPQGAGQFLIYGLVDPQTGQLRYIGKSSHGLQRPKEHMCPGKLKREQTHKSHWIRHLLSMGASPEILILEELFSYVELDEAEIRLIEYYTSIGCSLTNHTKGGDGVFGYKHTLDSRKKISEANKGRPLTEEHRKLISSIRTGKPLSEEHKKSIGRSSAGRTQSPEERLKKSLAAKKRWASVPVEDRKMSSEVKEKISLGLKGRIISEVQRVNLSKALRGRVFSEETRHKMSESAKRRSR